METLSDVLKKRRMELNLSLREAANLIGISHGYLDKLEKALDTRTQMANKPSPDVLKLISTKYSLSYPYLMELCGYISPQDASPELTPKIRSVARKMDTLSSEDLAFVENLINRLITDHENK